MTAFFANLPPCVIGEEASTLCSAAPRMPLGIALLALIGGQLSALRDSLVSAARPSAPRLRRMSRTLVLGHLLGQVAGAPYDREGMYGR